MARVLAWQNMGQTGWKEKETVDRMRWGRGRQRNKTNKQNHYPPTPSLRGEGKAGLR